MNMLVAGLKIVVLSITALLLMVLKFIVDRCNDLSEFLAWACIKIVGPEPSDNEEEED